ncbi:hypothetical protein F5884DRAFT_56823 [Xylogone sp. PMI_703]|nr:hypothetical protein F5884DRAFT_56823 [Xylogone sp. PMI_703]
MAGSPWASSCVLRAAVALWATTTTVNAANTFPMTWSSLSFGPDGPWQAVQIKIGSSDTIVSLYPGGSWSSHILSPRICSNASLGDVCYAQSAGLYDYTLSDTSAFGNVSLEGGVDFSGGTLQMGGEPSIIGTDSWDIGNSMETLVDMNMAIHESIWGTLPDGSTYPLSVGSLGLGAPNTINQTFGYGDSRPAFNATLLPGWLTTEAPSNKILSSNAYGMHIGAVSPKIAPSLYFGGFDRNRVLGTVSTQQGYPDSQGSIDMLDVGLTVVSGESPFNSTNVDGLLASGNSSISDSLPVAINSLAPYLHLPKSTCDAIASYLPVKYQAKYGLYFWDTSDPQYERITSSPSALTFTFRASESANDNFTINVPFRLLNLTLTAPLTTTPTTYFPCKAEEATYYQLGRSFLQAAFVGVNWNGFNGSAAWWLAQAPGPNTPTQLNIIAIGNDDTSITGSSSDWAATWKGYWTDLKESTPTSSNSTSSETSKPSGSMTPNTSSGLSSGAKAGIGVGVALGVIAIGAAAGFFFWRRRRASQAPNYATAPQQMSQHELKPSVLPPALKPDTQQYPPASQHSYVPASQHSSGGPEPVEADTTEHRYELS